MKKNISRSDFYKDIISDSANNKKDAFILTVTDESNLGSKALASRKQDGSISLDLIQDSDLEEYWKNLISGIDLSGSTYQYGETSVFIESISPRIPVVICGGGHVSLALSKLCKFMNYDLIILEDRAEFANPVRFPDAKRIIVDSFENIFKNNDFEPNACFCDSYKRPFPRCPVP